jgi:hypothetical protein
VRFPAGRPLERETPERLGLWGLVDAAAGGLSLEVGSRRFAYAVRVHAPGFRSAEDAFGVEPDGRRRVALRPREPGATFAGCSLTAINMSGRVTADPGTQAQGGALPAGREQATGNRQATGDGQATANGSAAPTSAGEVVR